MRKKHNKGNRIKHKEEGARDTGRTKNEEYGFGKAEYNKQKGGLFRFAANRKIYLHVFDSSYSQRNKSLDILCGQTGL